MFLALVELVATSEFRTILGDPQSFPQAVGSLWV